MNLKEIQIKKATDRASMESLKKGKHPSLSIINEFLKRRFNITPMGLPTFKPLFGKKYEVSNPQQYNNMLDTIDNDLEDLYEADNSCNNELLSIFSYYDSEKKKIDSSINNVQNRLDNLLNGTKQDQNKDSIFDNFDDFSKIDFIGNSERGIPFTDSFIDLSSKAASNDTTSNNSKIPLKGSKNKVDINSEVLSTMLLSDIENCLNDSLNESWIQKVVCEKDSGVKLRLSIELENERDITTIKFQLQSPRKSMIRLSISNAEKETRTLKEITTLDTAEWNIKRSKVKVLVFDIVKFEPDAMNGVEFEYYVGAKSISVYNDTHVSKSVLVSKPHRINQPFNYCNIIPEQVLPPDTSIKYFIGIDYEDNFITWEKLTPFKKNNLKLLEEVKSNISQDYTTEYGTEYKDLFVFAKLDHIPVPNTSKLYVGKNMWERSSVDITNKDSFNLKDLISKGIVDYVKMNNTRFNQKKNSAAIYTTYVYCSEPTALNTLIDIEDENAELTVFVNSVKIESENSDKTIRLSKGWNKVQVLSIADSSDTVLTINAYFYDVCSEVRAVRDSIEEVSIYDLLYNIHGTSYKHFSIVDDKVLVNFDPKNIGLEGTIDYMFTNNSFDNVNIRLMAILESFSKDVTPKLHNYKITTT